MKTVAVIGEFNPFHNGHALLLEEAKKQTGADRVITIMSGDYVQRGVPAITDRHVRARMALLGGADLVLSYPTRFSSSSAESFAEHAVRILDALGCVDILAFGSECGDLDQMQAAADKLVEEDETYKAALQENLKAGLSFPAARAEALPECREVLSSPNNILGVEYLKALKRTGSQIRPFTVLRQGCGHLDTEHLTALSSASMVRHVLSAGTNIPGLSVTIPPECFTVLKEDIGKYGVTTDNDYSLLLIDRLWKLDLPELLASYADVTEELAATILKKRNLFTNFDEFADLCKAKSMTRTHVNRAFLHIILGIRKNEVLDNTLFTQVLGFRTEAEEVLSAVSQQASIPVIRNPMRELDGLPHNVQKLFDEELRVSNLYESIRAQRAGLPIRNVLSKEIVRV